MSIGSTEDSSMVVDSCDATPIILNCQVFAFFCLLVLSELFETSRFVFAQSPYFSSWASKSNLDGAQEPNTPPTLVGGS